MWRKYMDTKDEQKLLSETLRNLLPPEEERKKFDQARQTANKELLTILTELVDKHGTQRFNQILHNYGFVDGNEFYSEPQAILERVKNRVKSIEGQSSDT